MRWRYRIIAGVIGFFSLFNYVVFLAYCTFWIGRYSAKYSLVKKIDRATAKQVEELGRIGIK